MYNVPCTMYHVLGTEENQIKRLDYISSWERLTYFFYMVHGTWYIVQKAKIKAPVFLTGSL
jgi:hypothetical protein